MSTRLEHRLKLIFRFSCAQNPSTLSISDVHYIDVTGSASGKVPNNTVATLECSATCNDITAQGTDLKAANGGTPVYLCRNLADEGLLDFQCMDV